jgi:hypothetical protein
MSTFDSTQTRRKLLHLEFYILARCVVPDFLLVGKNYSGVIFNTNG